MEKIYVDLNTLKYDATSHFDKGSKSKIYRLIDDRSLVFKHFDPKAVTCASLKRKEEMCKILTEMKGLSDICILPNELVIDKRRISKRFVGIIMDYFEAYPISWLHNYDDKVKALKMVRDMLLKLKKWGLLYFDVHCDNAIYTVDDNNLLDIKLIDMDDASRFSKVTDYNIDSLRNYLSIGGKPTFEAVIFIFNLTTYAMLTDYKCEFNYEFVFYEDKLKKANLLNSDISNFCYSMFNNRADQIADHEFLIDRVDNVCKAKER